MIEPPVFWQQQSLGLGPIAIALFPELMISPSNERSIAVGMAGNDSEVVLLLPGQFGMFLREHTGATLVCHDVGSVNWLLYEELNNQEDQQILWRFSRESRLHDLQILDQHARRTRTGDGTRGRTLAEMAVDYLNLHLPPDQEVEELAGNRQALFGPDPSLWQSLAEFASAMLQVHRHLSTLAEHWLTVIQEFIHSTPSFFAVGTGDGRQPAPDA